MCIKEARERLGKHLEKLLKRFSLNYSIDEEDSSSSHEKVLFFYIVRMFFPVMLVSIGLVTGFDVYFYWKYHSTDSYNDQKILYLFPIPCVAPSMFLVNFVMSVVTAFKLFHCDKCCDKQKRSEENGPLQDVNSQEVKEKSEEYIQLQKSMLEKILNIALLYLSIEMMRRRMKKVTNVKIS